MVKPVSVWTAQGKVEDRQKQLLWSSDPEGVEEAASKGFVKVIS